MHGHPDHLPFLCPHEWGRYPALTAPSIWTLLLHCARDPPVRPHQALGYLTPAEYLASLQADV